MRVNGNNVTQRAGAPHRASGFTLLEIIVAISIAALVLAVSVPAMQNLYSSSEYRGAVNDVVTLLSSARYAAIREGTPQDVLFFPEERVIKAGEQERILPDSIALEVLGSAQFNRDGAGVIRFYSDGGSTGGYVAIEHENGMSSEVQVDWLLGRVTTCSEGCDEAPLGAE